MAAVVPLQGPVVGSTKNSDDACKVDGEGVLDLSVVGHHMNIDIFAQLKKQKALSKTHDLTADAVLQKPSIKSVLMLLHTSTRVKEPARLEVFMNWILGGGHGIKDILSANVDAIEESFGNTYTLPQVTSGNTLLHTLVELDQYKAFKCVMKAVNAGKMGINIIIENEHKATPLAIACKDKNNRIIDRLMAYMRKHRIWMSRRDLMIFARIFPQHLYPYFEELEFSDPTFIGGATEKPWVSTPEGTEISQDCKRFKLRQVDGEMQFEVQGSNKKVPFHEGLWADRANEMDVTGTRAKLQLVQNFNLKAMLFPPLRAEVAVKARVIGVPHFASTQNPDERSLLKEFYECGHQAIFGTKIMQALLDYKWRAYGGWRYRFSFFVYIIYVVMFTFCMESFPYIGPVVLDTGVNIQGVNTVGNFVTHLILGAWTLMYLLFELKTIYEQKLDFYFGGNAAFFNVFELATFIFVLAGLYLHEKESILEANLSMSFAAVLAYGNVFMRTRCFEATGPFISMVKKIITDMWTFMLLLLVTLIAFAQAYYIIMNKTQPPREEDVTYKSLSDWLFVTYLMMLGEFAITLEFFDTGTATDYAWFATFLFILFSVICIIIELNLLIAIMGGSYNHVQEDGLEDDWRFEQAGVLVHVETHMSEEDRQNKHYFPTWLHVLTPAVEDTDNNDHIKERFQDMLNDVTMMMRMHEKATVAINDEFDTKCDILEVETRKLHVLRQRLETLTK